MKTLTILILTFTTISYSQLSNADSLSLSELYNKCNGKNWKNSSGWKISDFNNAYGLTLSPYEDTRIVSGLDLSSNKLNGDFPILPFRYLTKLDLSQNELSGQIPSIYLPYIEYLDLSRNGNEENVGLSGALKNFHIPEIIYLDLSQNDFSGVIPNLSLDHIKFLDLSNNDLVGPCPKLNMPELVKVNLSNNDLEGNPPRIVSSKLKYLDISSNKFNFAQLELLPEIDTIKYLDQNPNINITCIYFNGYYISFLESKAKFNIYEWKNSDKQYSFLTNFGEVKCRVRNQRFDEEEFNVIGNSVLQINDDFLIEYYQNNGKINLEFPYIPSGKMKIRIFNIEKRNLLSDLNIDVTSKMLNIEYPELKKGQYLVYCKYDNLEMANVLLIP